MGIVRGFMYAGAKWVVASLWKVDDDATGELMSRFYLEMLEQHRSPAAALREAQLALWRQDRWRPPFYWAAFVPPGGVEMTSAASTPGKNLSHRRVVGRSSRLPGPEPPREAGPGP